MVTKLDENLDSIPIAPGYFRTFICNKAYYADHKDEIPDGTVVYITDDAKETIEEVQEIIDRFVAEMTDRIEVCEQTVQEDQVAVADLKVRATSLENNRLVKPAATSSSNTFITGTLNGTETGVRTLSTLRGTLSGGTLYLYDN